MAEKEYIERGLAKRVLEANMSEIVAGAKPKGISGDAVIEGYLLGKDHAKDFIDAIPAADVVEVVRCKDCRYCESGKLVGGSMYFACCCEALLGDYAESIAVYSDDFCSYGERREQTDETDDAKDHSGND